MRPRETINQKNGPRFFFAEGRPDAETAGGIFTAAAEAVENGAESVRGLKFAGAEAVAVRLSDIEGLAYDTVRRGDTQ